MSQAKQQAHDPAPKVPPEPRPIPPMRVVTKGWWTMREKRATVEQLEKEAAEDDR